MSRGTVIARRRWCWAWALALLCLYPTAARAGALWSLASSGEIEEALRIGRLLRLPEGSALVVQRSQRCPAELHVINASGHAMWNVRVAASGSAGGKKVEREMRLPVLPARSKATVQFPCTVWGAGGASIPVSAAAAAPGSALGPDVIREILASKAEYVALYDAFLVTEFRSQTSIAAFALEYLLETDDRRLLRELTRQLAAEPAGAELLVTRLSMRGLLFLDADKVVAAARDGKVDIIAAMELDRALMPGCSGAGRSLRGCAKAITEVLGTSAEGMIAPRFLADLGAELRRQLLSESRSSAQDLISALPQLRAMGLDMAPIAQHLCEQAARRPDVGEDLLALAAQVEPSAPCIASSRHSLLWMDLRGRVITQGHRALIVLPVLLVALYLLWRGRRLRVKLGLGSEAPAAQGPAPGGVIGPRLDAKAWARSFEGGVADLRRGLDADGSEPCRAASAAIGRVMAEGGAAIAEIARGAAIDALRGGALRSVLARLEGLLLYVLVVPSARPEPKALVQHAPLTDGWAGHARRVVAGSPALAGAKLPVLSLILFVRPDASEVTLVAGYDDGQRRVWPGPLLAAGEARRVEGRVYPDHHEFNLEPA